MIQEILNKGSYKFSGTIQDLKRCIGSLKILRVIRNGNIQGVSFYDAEARFRYHGENYKLYISKIWTEEQLCIEYRGKLDG